MKRRRFLIGMASVAGSAFGLPVRAATETGYPNKLIKIVVGSEPGALLDIASRLYAEKLSALLKQQVVVENLPGASSMIATRKVAGAPHDGYLLLAAANTVVTMPHFVSNAGYSMKNDLMGIAEMARAPGILVVSAQSPYRSLAELVAAAKAKPGSITFGSGGQGTTSHLPVEMFMQEAKIKLTHVPYKGVAAALQDVIPGRVDSMLGTSTSLQSSLQSGQLRALAITSEHRNAAFGDIPTFTELGYPAVTYNIFVGLLAAAGTPAAVVNTLGDALRQVRHDPGVVARLKSMGQEISNLEEPTQFNRFLLDEEEKYATLIRKAGLQPG
ncbi:Bug family tripartite tricarboxylate transporter substrate binding protein [Advenella mimigardefordensis]|uniref:Putative Bug-like extracytoplasmic solute binding receptor, TTT family n=1 Tax=Advenella mimigardefordensis (strain DSM 17166 / LMG 22922 / DPN7) TaxID=1247726 RepID=W0PBH4_ADVMD|nr:tripartite tricarboxylate transporter substrate binding protein [Advenella mimigardefordensis]AHG64091.1 putative Bug-like extracytoplasmic solute binding receptor, TTT family [Advenella mimigardefordensis DPN7]